MQQDLVELVIASGNGNAYDDPSKPPSVSDLPRPNLRSDIAKHWLQFYFQCNSNGGPR